MESEATKVGRRGVVVIPSSFRKKYGFKEGSLVVAEAVSYTHLTLPTIYSV